MRVLRTPRLLLIQATAEALRAELGSSETLGEVLGADVPASWPPELYDADAMRWTLAWLANHPNDSDWSLYYVAEAPVNVGDRPQLVGPSSHHRSACFAPPASASTARAAIRTSRPPSVSACLAGGTMSCWRSRGGRRRRPRRTPLPND